MDGNTWRRYRFVVERGTEPPFFLEPDNPDEFVGHFTSCGFAPLANYTSALADDLSSDATDLSAPERRLKDGGIAVSHLDMARADETLKRIFHLSLDSFRGNFLYTPLEEDEFLEQNRRVLPAVVPELVLLAERDGELVGFLFGVPDVLQQQRGVRLDTLIVKTVAVASSAANAGIGGALVALVHARARALGFTRAIHALMHEQNTSQRISRHYARTIRRYTLYWRELTDVAGAAR
jgi:GNAT superfamily N-acetyltransferase